MRKKRKFSNKPLRLRGFDYAQPGAYFITICTHQRQGIFGRIRGAEMHLNRNGRIVVHCWRDIPRHFPQIDLDAFAVMPEHVHLILWILPCAYTGQELAQELLATPTSSRLPAASLKKQFPMPGNRSDNPPFQSPCGTVGSVIRSFKGAVSREIRRQLPVKRVWQKLYHDKIVWDAVRLYAYRRYILRHPTMIGLEDF